MLYKINAELAFAFVKVRNPKDYRVKFCIENSNPLILLQSKWDFFEKTKEYYGFFLGETKVVHKPNEKSFIKTTKTFDCFYLLINAEMVYVPKDFLQKCT